MSGSVIGTAERHGNTLLWKPGRRLTPNKYALTRQAGFRWQKGKKAWAAEHTPEREAFLLKFVSEIRRVDLPPFALSVRKSSGQPLDELVDARLTPNKKTLYLFLREGERYYTRRIDMTRQGAGLSAISEPYGNLHFVRGAKGLPETEETPFIRVVRTTLGFFTAKRDLAEALMFLLWGQEVTLEEWPEPEGVQVASEHLNAAD